MRLSVPPTLLLFPLLLACVPDFSAEAAAGKATADGRDDDSGADTAETADTADTADTDTGAAPPAWSGLRDAAYTIEDPRGRTLCEGTIVLDISPDGHLAGEADCAIQEGPGSGTTAALALTADADTLADDAIAVRGTATLDIPTPDGAPPSGALDGTLSAAEAHLRFSLPIGGGGGGGGGSFTGAVDSP